MEKRLNNVLAPYASPFALILRDLDRLFEYVHPVDAHKDVYSLRAYELLLRAATEFESTCKDVSSVVSIELPGEPNITHYWPIAKKLDILNARVVALRWTPMPLVFAPFSKWTDPRQPLPWYRSYNCVKHHRHSEFSNASINNALHAVGAVFVMLAIANVLESDEPSHRHNSDGSTDHRYKGLSLSLRTDASWTVHENEPQ